MQEPRIVYSPLTKAWYVVTRYREKLSSGGVPYIVASVKFDVTQQMKAILSKRGKAAVESGRPMRVTV